MKKGNIKPILIIVAMLFITVCSFTSVSFAKYVKYINYSTTGVVATPIVVFSGLTPTNNEHSIMLEEMGPQSASKAYSFSVVNFINEIQSEVALNYNISLSTTSNLPLIITLKKSNIEVYTLNTSQNSNISPYYLFNAHTSQTDLYEIHISWDPLAINSEYSGQIDKISICVHWKQID